ncbi:MAG: PolC-type DNA polymerase III [Christensenellaceae bacterium]|nr:PolC-type DNA polymerase III [Christensenellaceae bacterium]
MLNEPHENDRELFPPEKKKLAAAYSADGTIKLTSAVRCKKTGEIRVNIEARRILLPAEMDAISMNICDELPQQNVKCIYDFSNVVRELEQGQGDPGSLLCDLWCELSPQLAPILMRCRIERHGNEFVFFVPVRYHRALAQQQVSDFRALISRLYDWHAAIRIVADESMKDGAEEFEPIVKRDWGRAASVAKPKKVQKKSLHKLAQTDIILGKEILKPDVLKMCELDDKSGRITVMGTVLSMEVFVSPKRGTVVLTVFITDKTNTVAVKLFPDEMTKQRTISLLEKARDDGAALMVRGFYRYDNYARDYCLFADDINRYPVERRADTSPDKRVELHLHTQMSAMDATTKLGEVVALAAKWGHKAIAITDHGVVHSFPDAKKAAKKHNIKVIFGCEGYLLPDCELVPAERSYCAVSVTYIGSGVHSRIFELASVRFLPNGTRLGSFRTAVNPGVPLTPQLKELTGYTEDDIEAAPVLSEAVEGLASFIGDDMVVSHDCEQLGLLHELVGDSCGLGTNCVSSAMLMQYLRRNLKPDERRLPVLNAADSAEWTADVMTELLTRCGELGVDTVPVIDCTASNTERKRTNHIILLASTQSGLKNLYKLVSYSNLDHFYKTPRIPRSLLNIHREGLILGSACEAGELFRAVIENAPEEKLIEIASWYDFLEIQPIGNNSFLVRDGIAKDDEQLRDYNRRIVELGEKLDKPVVATGDVHFLEPEDSIYRAILMNAMNFKDAINQAPLYFKTTDEMLAEFEYLGRDKAFEVVVENTNKIADMCAQLRPFLDEKQTYAPELPGAADELKGLAMNKAHELYGDELPEIVQKRLDKELNSIIGNGYSSLYMVAQKLVSKSLGDGYLVGSRGSVGSSFVAHLAGITEVNALAAHYRCPNCKYSEFPDVGDDSRCGIDLPKKDCPNCGTPLRREGYEIPFETFLGFKGDKTPDIDLNFSGEYQPVAHKFTEEMFGEGHAFRAGTISGIKDKTAYGYVMHYCEDYEQNLSEAEKNRLASGCVGTRRTTGQHPGGIVIVPEDLEIFDFCPVQHPAEKVDAESITTHFDFHALDDKLVKLDILGHDDPTTLRMLQDITGLDPKQIPLSDEETMSIFKSEAALGISLKELNCDVGSLGIPEFGTNFVRGMLMDTRPTTMEELVRIAGLSHGTDVWLNNAQDLVRDGTATLMEVICTRDDIMNYLIAHGGEPSLSFKTMESVRKGRGLTPEMEDAMHMNSIPQWYIDSCKKIKYMFPRAHAAAYVMMSFRVAYYKVHYPLAFYAVYFTVRADTFDIEKCSGGANAVLANIKAMHAKDSLDTKDEDQLVILEMVYEMNLRGIELLPIDIYKSKATKFTIEGNCIRPPFNAIAGLGNNAADCIEKGAEGGAFISREDFAKRTKANSSVMEKLERLGCLKELPDSNQVSMF